MKHRGYIIRRYSGEFDTAAFRLSGVSIIAPDGLIKAVAQDADLAKRTIDSYVDSGRWKDFEAKSIGEAMR